MARCSRSENDRLVCLFACLSVCLSVCGKHWGATFSCYRGGRLSSSPSGSMQLSVSCKLFILAWSRQKWESVEETAEFLLSQTQHRPRIAVILGTGSGRLASLLNNVDDFPYHCIPHFVHSTGISSICSHVVWVFTARCTLVQKRGIAIACRLSVCPSVCPSVCL